MRLSGAGGGSVQRTLIGFLAGPRGTRQKPRPYVSLKRARDAVAEMPEKEVRARVDTVYSNMGK